MVTFFNLVFIFILFLMFPRVGGAENAEICLQWTRLLASDAFHHNQHMFCSCRLQKNKRSARPHVDASTMDSARKTVSCLTNWSLGSIKYVSTLSMSHRHASYSLSKTYSVAKKAQLKYDLR